MKKNELKNKIRTEILNGDYDDEGSSSTQLPSENKLAERFNVSRSTIREVLALLTQEG
ncbi:GntR family transcriptional regulator, partial [Vibrio harveyi]